MVAPSGDLEKKLTMAVERMPAFPQSVQKILELTRNINCQSRDLVTVIEKDPVMTVKILKVINSAFYGLQTKVTSVGQSVVYLGINTVKNLALSFAAVGVLPRKAIPNFDVQQYLLHSLFVAALARQLAIQYTKGAADPGDCYTAGLLHDFGKPVFAQYLGTEFAEAAALARDKGIPLHEAEQQVIGTDHAYVGAMLVRRWQFPQTMIACIEDHHNPDAPSSALMDCLRAANQIARRLEVGHSGYSWREGEAAAAAERFGPDLDATIASLGDIKRFTADAEAFAEVSSG